MAYEGSERRKAPGWEEEVSRLDKGHAHILQRLDAQDELLKDIRSLLLAGKFGLAVIRWVTVTVAAILAAWASYKGITK